MFVEELHKGKGTLQKAKTTSLFSSKVFVEELHKGKDKGNGTWQEEANSKYTAKGHGQPVANWHGQPVANWHDTLKTVANWHGQPMTNWHGTLKAWATMMHLKLHQIGNSTSIGQINLKLHQIEQVLFMISWHSCIMFVTIISLARFCVHHIMYAKQVSILHMQNR